MGSIYRIVEVTPSSEKRWAYTLYDLYGVESHKMEGKVMFEDGGSIPAVIKEWVSNGQVWYTACGNYEDGENGPVSHDWKVGELFCFGKDYIEMIGQEA